MDSWRTTKTTALLVVGLVLATSFITTLLFFALGWGPNPTPAAPPSDSDASSTSVVATGTPAAPSAPSSGASHAPPASAAATTFHYAFSVPGTLQEASAANKSTSPYWFLDSGGKLIITGGIGETIQGTLALEDTWRTLYAENNPIDTDDGTHPQNIFRLVTKSAWTNATEELWYRITADNLSASPNRNESNGLLLMSRYESHDTLYYAGIRVDGTAVIKKKYQGVYYTMAQVPLFPGTYDATESPNLLPHDVWLGLRVLTQTNADGSVTVKLYYAPDGGSWTLVASARDAGQYGGTTPITSGIDGVRTDFMDVEFKDFSITGTELL